MMKHLQVLNVRFGFATNSSSTHSLLFLPKNHNVSDNLVDGESFGWEYFTAISEGAKRRYLAQTLKYGLENREGVLTVPENISKLIIENWAGTQYNPDGNIDHQSIINLPRTFGSEFPDEDFFKELLQWALQPNLAILGGNDNVDDDDPNDRHPLGFGFTLPLDRESKTDFVCRKEKDYWILFNKGDGTKIRFRFCNNRKEMVVAPQKPLTPELVDLKITNFCPYGCPMCYQNSKNEQGDEEYNAYSMAEALWRLKVFEVAIGGGEPTWSKHFQEILTDLHRRGITCNFSTRNLDWLRDAKQIEAIIPNIGAFAYSLISPDDIGYDDNKIKELSSLLTTNNIKTKAILHAIVGPKCFQIYDIDKLLSEANTYGFPVTLLGFKQTGRASNVKVDASFFNGLIKEIKKWKKKQQCYSPIGIDTTLASYLGKELKEEGISDLLYATKEGVYSCYVDMTQRKIGPSSYCDPKDMVSYGDYNEEETIVKAFAGF